jgi:quercetin dioxygenase-like cupin family protein
MNLLFKPGEVLEKHKTPVDVFFYVVKGKGFIEIGDEESLVEATDIVFSPKGIPHGLRALPEEEFQETPISKLWCALWKVLSVGGRTLKWNFLFPL